MTVSSTDALLLARVARSYFLDERSKSDIAEELGISRFRVARLLETARREGVVTIEISSPAGIDTELSLALKRRFGLEHAVVVEHDERDADSLRRRLSVVAAEVLREVVTTKDVLGLAWARSLRGIGDNVAGIAACPVVQLTGALSGPDGSDVLALVRKVAQAGGGVPHVFYAPLVAPDAASARTLRRQPEVARALQLAESVTVAVVGIGAWAPGLSTIYDTVDAAARIKAADAGTIGEISGILIDGAGRAVISPLSRRVIGISGEQLAGVDMVLSVAYGADKCDAVRSALTGGLVNSIVTHTELAEALLADSDRRDEGAPVGAR